MMQCDVHLYIGYFGFLRSYLKKKTRKRKLFCFGIVFLPKYIKRICNEFRYILHL